MTGQLGGPQDQFYANFNIVPLPLIVRAKGVQMFDEAGREYIDASSGPVVSNIGHGNERVIEAMARQARQCDFASSRVARHQPNIDLTRKIAEMAGGHHERVALASGGSEAMEIALKFLRQYALATGSASKKTIITLESSYHGGTIATLAISGDPALDGFVDGFAVKSERIPTPWQYRVQQEHSPESYRMHCAEALDRKIREIGAENVLAFVIEPVGGLATGALVMHEDYLNRIREICDHHGTYLVYDEILCGTGRTGTFLASEPFLQARADLVVLAKGLASGYAPLGAVLMPANMVDELADLTGFNFSHTYNANPITCATGVAVLEEYDRQNLLTASKVRGAQLRLGLERLAQAHWCVGDVRGRGLLLAVELVRDRVSKTPFPGDFAPTEQVRIAGLKNNLIIYSRRTADGLNGDWFIVAPPLTISEAEVETLLRRLDQTLTDFEEMAELFQRDVEYA